MTSLVHAIIVFELKVAKNEFIRLIVTNFAFIKQYK